MPIFGHTFFGHNSAVFGSIKLQFFEGAHETIIYRLIMRNQDYEACFSFFILWATFGGKMGMTTTRAPDDLGPQNPTEILAH